MLSLLQSRELFACELIDFLFQAVKPKSGVFCFLITEARETTALEMPDHENTFVLKVRTDIYYGTLTTLLIMVLFCRVLHVYCVHRLRTTWSM